jgi:hypothetical protein
MRRTNKTSGNRAKGRRNANRNRTRQGKFKRMTNGR